MEVVTGLIKDHMPEAVKESLLER